MRERTYWPELCVVQLAGEHEVAVIDAQAPEIDLAPLGELLADPAVMKVFHAARQDIEIFVLRFGDVPSPLFDTQVAAMVAGFGDQVGYDALVSSLTGGQIDKAHRFSDWSARPLSASQIAYAAADVTYLRTVYTSAVRAAGAGRPARLGGARRWRCWPIPAPTAPIPRRCGNGCARARNNRRLLGMLRALAAWREREAQRVNIPRQRLVRDESAAGDRRHRARRRRRRWRAPAASRRGFAEGRTGASLLAAIAGGEGAARGRAARGAARRATAPGRRRRWCRC